jgi:hypothetical protein
MNADDNSKTVDDYKAILEGNVGVVKSFLAEHIENTAGELVDLMLHALDRPHWKIKVGKNDPAANPAQEFISDIPSAVERGMKSLIDEGKTLAQEAGKFVTFEVADPSDIFENALSADLRNRLIQFAKSPGNTKLDDLFNPDPAWRTFPFIKQVGVKFPLIFNDGGPVAGAFFAGATDVSWETLRGNAGNLAIAGTIQLTQPVTRGAYEFRAFKFEGGFLRDVSTDRNSYGANLGIEIVR